MNNIENFDLINFTITYLLILIAITVLRGFGVLGNKYLTETSK